MATSIICERGFAFACRILKLCELLGQRGPTARHVASQLMRCSTSIGSNAEEAQEAQTKPDFIAKLSVSRKEARETIFWLKLGVAANVVTREEVEGVTDEANQLLAMVRAAIKTARSSSSRGEPIHP